ncbi:WD40 repeat domain-containing protein [Streptomyces sp. CBMA123]|uniref:WD40 repeat domain-containing protein n=1 Tax=Streptomyces sp. CBMA123 TaxID=1896313 RepID=UPI00166201CD|nr:hypothetical protein [Streptomyces sp. CBMA123]
MDLMSNESVRPPWLLPGHCPRIIRCIATTNGRNLVVVQDRIPDRGEGLQVRDLVSGEDLEFEGQETVGRIQEIVCTDHDGCTVVAVLCWDGAVHAWDAQTGRTVGRRIELPADGETHFRTIAAGTLANGHLAVAVANAEAPVRLWDLESGEPSEHTIPGDPIRTMLVVWGPSGLFTAGDSGTLQRWDASTGEAMWSPFSTGQGPFLSALLCARVAGTDVVISGGNRGTVCLWDACTGERLGVPLAVHDSSVRSLAWAELPDGRAVLVTGGNENTARSWELHALDGRTRQATRVPAVTSVIQVAGRTVSGHTDGVLRVWDAGEAVAELAGSFRVLAQYSDLAIAAGSRGDGMESTLRLWSLAGGQEVGAPRELPTTGTVACITELDGAAVAVVGGENNAVEAAWLPTGERLWRTRTRERTKWENCGRFRRLQEITAITTATLPDGRTVVVSGSMDGTIRIRDLRTGRRLGTSMNVRAVEQPSPAAVSALVSTRLPDGRIVAIACSEDTTRATVAAWDLVTCRPVATTAVATGWVHRVVCITLPDGTPLP